MAKPQAPVGAPRDVVGSSDHIRRLVTLRDRLESAMDEAGPRDLAPLAGRYQAVLTELASMPAVREVSVVGDLAARRAGRSAS